MVVFQENHLLMILEIYKIRRKSDGLFSTGGLKPKFSKKGKSWPSRGNVTNHLSLFTYEKRKFYYDDCEVVCILYQELNTESIDVSDWKPTKATIRAKELEKQRRIEFLERQKRRD
jgi:hypothetical protein